MSEGLGGSWRIAAITLVFGLAADMVLRGPLGAGILVLAFGASTAAVLVCRPRPAAIPFLLAGCALMVFSVLRTSPTLLALDVLASAGLLIVAMSFAREGRPLATTVVGYLRRGVMIVRSVPEGVTAPVAPFARAVRRTKRVRLLPRAVLMVTPVLALFLVLLGSADPVFAHYLRTSLSAVPPPTGLATHLVLIVAGTIGLATLLAYGMRTTEPDQPPSGLGRSMIRRGEWVLLLAGVDAVFVAFVLVQIAYFFGGRTRVLQQEGLTFADYARGGFAQLLVASMLTTVLIAAVWTFGRRETGADARLFSWLAGALVVLTLVVLVSAFRRLSLYESAYGWTWPRLLGHAVVIFLGASLLCGLAWIVLRRGRWLATAVVVAGLVTLVGLNVLDPDRFIAERNLDRYAELGRLDIREFAHLSPDATPAIVRSLPTLPPDEQRFLRHLMACERDELQSEPDGIGSWNLARSRALASLEGADLGRCGPPPISALGPTPAIVTR